MFLKHLELSGFRNIAPQQIDFETPVTIISGRNGQGKTSLLEAIYLLSHSRSFRTAKLREVVSWGSRHNLEVSGHTPSGTESAGSARVAARLVRDSGEREILLEITRAGRTVLVNGKRLARFSEFFGQVQSVAFTPETVQLVKGGPLARRTFLDRTLAMIDERFVDAALAYHQALKHRNAILGGRSGRASDVTGHDLEPWDRLLVRHGREIAAARLGLISELMRDVPLAYHEVASGGRADQISEDVTLRYQSDYIGNGDVRPESEILEELTVRFDRDRRNGSTSFGIHRDEVFLALRFPGSEEAHDARSSASQGQARSLALALTFATIDFLQRRSGEPPIILLDDVESELDASRRGALLKRIGERKNQVFLTTTDASQQIFPIKKTVSFFNVTDGAFQRVINS